MAWWPNIQKFSLVIGYFSDGKMYALSITARTIFKSQDFSISDKNSVTFSCFLIFALLLEKYFQHSKTFSDFGAIIFVLLAKFKFMLDSYFSNSKIKTQSDLFGLSNRFLLLPSRETFVAFIANSSFGHYFHPLK